MSIKLLLGGDAMLGRLFNYLAPLGKKPLIQKLSNSTSTLSTGDGARTENSPWSETMARILQGHDGTIINLETTITHSKQKWPDKTFNYRMLPRNSGWLTEANVIACSLANNHILDYQLQGLLDTQDNLEDLDIAHAGAGLDLTEAMKPVYLEYEVDNMTVVDNNSESVSVSWQRQIITTIGLLKNLRPVLPMGLEPMEYGMCLFEEDHIQRSGKRF